MRLAILLLLAGCAGAPADSYTWSKSEEVTEVIVRKLETPLAMEFCSGLLGKPFQVGCAVWTEPRKRCVIVIRPGDAVAAAHEVGGHCVGFDHQ